MSGLQIEGSTADSSVALTVVEHQPIDAAPCIHIKTSQLAEANAVIRIAHPVNTTRFESMASKSVSKLHTMMHLIEHAAW